MKFLRRYYTKNELPIIVVFIATIIMSIWGRSEQGPQIEKLFIAISMWYAIFNIRRANIIRAKNQTPQYIYFLYSLLLMFGVVQTLRSAIWGNTYGNGNLYITLFGNEYTALLLAAPIFYFLSFVERPLLLLKRFSHYFACWCMLLTITDINFYSPVNIILLSIFIFFPYYSKKEKLIYLILIPFTIKFGLDGMRSFLILLTFGIISLLISKWKKLTTIFCLSILLLTLGTIIYSIQTKESPFTHMSKYSNKQNMVQDTRTFLYTELAEDLNETHSWILGKGAYSGYYSEYFSKSYNQIKGHSTGRLTNEVTFLTYLLRAGIIYLIIFNIIIILAIVNILRKSQNEIMLRIAISLTGFFFNGYIGDMLGCNFFHLTIWMMIGLAFQKKYLIMNNNNIKHILCE